MPPSKKRRLAGLDPAGRYEEIGEAAISRMSCARGVQPGHDEPARTIALCALALRRLRGPRAGRKQRNHAFCMGTAVKTPYDFSYFFNNLRGGIRYLAEQWNFAADQRIYAYLSIEKQWNLYGVRKWRIVVALRARADERARPRFQGDRVSSTGARNVAAAERAEPALSGWPKRLTQVSTKVARAIRHRHSGRWMGTGLHAPLRPRRWIADTQNRHGHKSACSRSQR
jgi:hypothetical protein